MFGSSTPPEIPSSLIALNPKDGGLGIQKPSEVSKNQFEASITKTAIHVETIIAQEQKMNKLSKDGESQKEIDSKIKKMTEERRKHSIEALDLAENLSSFVRQARDTGASSWLNALPIREQQLNLNKGQFSDALALRYGLPSKSLPSMCVCGSPFSVAHALDCNMVPTKFQNFSTLTPGNTLWGAQSCRAPKSCAPNFKNQKL